MADNNYEQVPLFSDSRRHTSGDQCLLNDFREQEDQLAKESQERHRLLRLE